MAMLRFTRMVVNSSGIKLDSGLKSSIAEKIEKKDYLGATELFKSAINEDKGNRSLYYFAKSELMLVDAERLMAKSSSLAKSRDFNQASNIACEAKLSLKLAIKDLGKGKILSFSDFESANIGYIKAMQGAIYHDVAACGFDRLTYRDTACNLKYENGKAKPLSYISEIKLASAVDGFSNAVAYFDMAEAKWPGFGSDASLNYKYADSIFRMPKNSDVRMMDALKKADVALDSLRKGAPVENSLALKIQKLSVEINSRIKINKI